MRIGLDPEIAIVSKKTGLARSAHLFINEKKVFNFHYDDGSGNMPGSEVERDGAAIEIRSIVPSVCRDNIIPYVAEALRQTQLDLDKWGKKAYALSTTPLYELDDESLKDPPEDVVEFGCRPDLSAYSLDVKDPACPEGDKRRFTGGHIHYSTMKAKNNVQQQAAIAILYDYFIVVPMVAILGEKFALGETERRQFYGQPGSFRYDDSLDKIEFRTLSGRLMLHPTLLYWVLGAMKSLYSNVRAEIVNQSLERDYVYSNVRAEIVNQSLERDYVSFLKDYIIASYSPDLIHKVIIEHDWEQAEDITLNIFKLLPSYQVREQDLANPLSGGGGGTMNPYFYEQAARVFIEGNKVGLMWDDDLVKNWGLYKDYEPKHHSYWGVQQAMVGLCDSDIFPFNEILPKIWPTELLQKTPLYTHPLNGGDKRYVTAGAAHWLQ